MNAEYVLGILLALACIAIIYQGGVVTRLRRKNEAQRQMIEAPAPQPKRINPERIKVELVEGKSAIVHGWKFHYPNDGRLLITDDNDLACAAFGPGKWISAVVESQPKTPKPEEAK